MKKNKDEIRKELNDDLVKAIKNNEDLGANIDYNMIFFPPRPIIKKDLNDIKKVYKLRDINEN